MGQEKHGIYEGGTKKSGQNAAGSNSGDNNVLQNQRAPVGNEEMNNSANPTPLKYGTGVSGNKEQNGCSDYDIHEATVTKGTKSFASLFKDNRLATESSMLEYIAPPEGALKIGFDEIDTVEKSFGFCLVGFVLGSRPSPLAVQKFVKGWGNTVKFIFKDNGWIKFQFPSELDRDKVLNGGPYMIMGRQLFLRKLTSCFLYSKEDMVSLPSWVQIHGLPADCWTPKALSKIASIVGKPIHSDKLTISKKGHNYARVLVEMDAMVSRIEEYPITLPTDKTVILKFIYELAPKFCDKCNALGHSSDMCGRGKSRIENKGGDTDNGQRGVRPQHEVDGIDGNVLSDEGINHVDKDVLNLNELNNSNGEGVKMKSSHVEDTCSSNYHASGDEKLNSRKLDTCPTNLDDSGDENLATTWDNDSLHDDGESNYDYYDDMLSHVVPQDQEDWILRGKKSKKSVKGKHKDKDNSDSNMGGCHSSSVETEYIPIDPRSKLPLLGGASKFLKKKLVEGRPPRR